MKVSVVVVHVCTLSDVYSDSRRSSYGDMTYGGVRRSSSHTGGRFASWLIPVNRIMNTVYQDKFSSALYAFHP